MIEKKIAHFYCLDRKQLGVFFKKQPKYSMDFRLKIAKTVKNDKMCN